MGLGLLCVALLQPHRIQMLFLGNSHTAANDLTGIVRSLLESDGSGRRADVRVEFAALLNDYASRKEVLDEIQRKKWDYIVLQGASMSSSHKYVYSQEGGIQVCRAAVKSGAKTFLFAEWPRRGWDETSYILGIYGSIAKQAGGTVMGVPKCWDVALSSNRNLDLWAADGNHSSPRGAYLAACGIYYSIFGPGRDPGFVPTFLTKSEATDLRGAAKKAIAR